MALLDDVQQGLPEFRLQAESLMTLVLAAYEPGGTTTDGNGYEVQGYTPKGLTFGKVQAGSRQGGDTVTKYVRIGEVERSVIEAGLHIPIDALVPSADYQRGFAWEYEVVNTGDSDPALLGRRYLVVGVPAKSLSTARRLDVVEL